MCEWMGLVYPFRIKFQEIESTITSVLPLANLKKIFAIHSSRLSVNESNDMEEVGVTWNITLSIEEI